MLTVLLPDGSNKQFPQAVSVLEVAQSIGEGLARAAIAGEVDGVQRDLSYQLPDSGEVRLRLLTKRDPEALDVMRHSAAHVMAQAVMRLYDGVQLAFGPATDTGFYYDMRLPKPLGEEDFPSHRGRDEEDRPRRPSPSSGWSKLKSDSIQLCEELGQEFKVEHLETGLGDEESSFVLPPGRVHRPVPRRPHPQHRRTSARRSSCSASPARTGKATPTASSCSGSTPPPSSTRKNSTSTCTGSKRPRSATTACSASSSSCSPSTRRSARA